jgi:peptidylprolyl isomerase
MWTPSVRALALIAAMAFAGCHQKKLVDPADTPADAEAAATSASSSASSVSPAPPPSAPQDAEKTASGISTVVLKTGAGSRHPVPTDVVELSYTAWQDGTRLEDSAPGQTFTFPLRLASPGWVEGVQRMVEGETRRMWIPAALAQPRGAAMAVPPGDLIFDINLIAIVPSPPLPPTPPDVHAPPADARKTRSGLAFRVLSHGPGSEAKKPTGDAFVTIAYTGWTAAGKLFDTTIPLAAPTIRLGELIPGLREGLQLMKVGDVMRFWIPGRLAYDASEGSAPAKPVGMFAPTGMVVFDVELYDASHADTRVRPR